MLTKAIAQTLASLLKWLDIAYLLFTLQANFTT